MNTMSFRWGCLLLLFVLLGACTDPQMACEDGLGCVALRPGEPLVIAALIDTTGPAAAISADVLGGMAIAIGDRSDALFGHPIELLEMDTNCRADSALLAAQELAADERVVGVIGPLCAAAAETAVPLLDTAGLVVISPTDTGSNLPLTASRPPAYYRTAPAYERQGALLAQFASEELGARRATVLYTPDTYLESIAVGFRRTFESLGGLVLYADQIDAGQSDVTSALATTAAVQPDVVYLGLFEPEALVLVTQLRENDALADAVLLGSDALLLDSFARSAGAAINNMYLSAPTAAGSGYDAFLQAWALRNEGSPQRAYGAFAYDATSILLNALVDAAQLSGDESMLIGRTRLRAAVAMTNTESRVTGALVCTAVGECAGQATLGVFRLQDRELPNSSWPPQRVWLPEED